MYIYTYIYTYENLYTYIIHMATSQKLFVQKIATVPLSSGMLWYILPLILRFLLCSDTFLQGPMRSYPHFLAQCTFAIYSDTFCSSSDTRCHVFCRNVWRSYMFWYLLLNGCAHSTKSNVSQKLEASCPISCPRVLKVVLSPSCSKSHSVLYSDMFCDTFWYVPGHQIILGSTAPLS